MRGLGRQSEGFASLSSEAISLSREEAIQSLIELEQLVIHLFHLAINNIFSIFTAIGVSAFILHGHSLFTDSANKG